MSTKTQLKEAIKRENNLNKIILNLAQLEGNRERLFEILQGLNIGEKRTYNEQLENFVNSNPEVEEKERKEFLQLIDENKQIYDDIEKEIIEKLGLELKRTEKSKNAKNKKRSDDFDDFQEEFVDLSLIASLGSISSSQRIIQQEIANLQITPQNIDRVAVLLNKTEIESINWLKYLAEQKKQNQFILLDDRILDLYDVTIVETKKTLQMVDTTKEKIAGRSKESNQGEEEQTKEGQKRESNSKEKAPTSYSTGRGEEGR